MSVPARSSTPSGRTSTPDATMAPSWPPYSISGPPRASAARRAAVARPPALQRAVDDHVDRRLRGPGEDQLLAGARAYPPRVRGERGHRGGRQPTERAGAQRVEAARLVRGDRPLGEALAQPAPALAD